MGKQRIEEYGGWFPFHMVCILSISFSLSLYLYIWYEYIYVCSFAAIFSSKCVAMMLVQPGRWLVVSQSWWKSIFNVSREYRFVFLEDLKCSCWNNRILSHLSKKASINHQSTINQPSINHQYHQSTTRNQHFPHHVRHFCSSSVPQFPMFLPGVGCWCHGCQRPEPIQARWRFPPKHGWWKTMKNLFFKRQKMEIEWVG